MPCFDLGAWKVTFICLWPSPFHRVQRQFGSSVAEIQERSQRWVEGKLARWVLFLADYNFDLVHVKGKRNIVHDVLSRNPRGSPEETEPLKNSPFPNCLFISEREKLEEIRLTQRCDTKISPLICQLENPSISDGRKVARKFIDSFIDSKNPRK